LRSRPQALLCSYCAPLFSTLLCSPSAGPGALRPCLELTFVRCVLAERAAGDCRPVRSPNRPFRELRPLPPVANRGPSMAATPMTSAVRHVDASRVGSQAFNVALALRGGGRESGTVEPGGAEEQQPGPRSPAANHAANGTMTLPDPTGERSNPHASALLVPVGRFQRWQPSANVGSRGLLRSAYTRAYARRSVTVLLFLLKKVCCMLQTVLHFFCVGGVHQ
jgi:hypothetical protein